MELVPHPTGARHASQASISTNVMPGIEYLNSRGVRSGAAVTLNEVILSQNMGRMPAAPHSEPSRLC